MVHSYLISYRLASETQNLPFGAPQSELRS